MPPPIFRAVFFDASEQDMLWQVQRFRKRVFVDQCCWDLKVIDDREVDQFDGSEARYMGLWRDDELCACFRAIRSDAPYLAATVFPQLAVVNSYPSRPDVWEISRFGTSGEDRRALGPVTYALMFWFARHVRASALVALADLTYERFLRGLGIRTRRFGPPQVIGVDRHGRDLRAVAGEIPLALQDPARIASLLAHLDSVEIIDAAQVRRPSRVSA